MDKKCSCGPDCACKKVTIKDKIHIEKILISTKDKNLATCMFNIEQYCKLKGYEIDGGSICYRTTTDGQIIVDFYARKYNK